MPAPVVMSGSGESTKWTRLALYALAGILVPVCLYLLAVQNYLLYHSLIEGFSIIVASGMFVVAWNVRRFLNSDYVVFMGIAYLFVASIDFMHVLSYAGMGVIRGSNDNLATQLWIAARYVQSGSLFIAPIFLYRRLNAGAVMLSYAAITAMLFALIFHGVFPDCYVAGKGLTPFKIASEYAISAVLAASWFILYRSRAGLSQTVYRLVSASLVTTIASEMAFTLYTDVHGVMNIIGHLLKFVSFYFMYKAILETGLVRPFDLLFRDLKTNEAALTAARDDLERRVAQRTSQLVTANKSLRDEIEARGRSEHALAERIKELSCLSKLGRIVEQEDTSLEEMFERVARLIPEGWQYTASAVARIRLHNEVYEHGSVDACESALMSRIKVDGEQVGSVEVGYLHDFPDADEGPFLKEERQLIDMIAERLGHVIEREHAQQQRTLLEIQLRQAQKMESIGRLAGGVAHDFNNMLAIIQGNLELTLDGLDPTADDTIALRQAHEAGQRAAGLTHQLLAFARKQAIEPRTLDLNEVVEGMTDMLKRLIGENIDLQWHPSETPAVVTMDRVQIDQILVNLLVNARDAVSTVGRVTVKTAALEFGESSAQRHVESKPGRYVLLAVSDDGEGMDEHTLSAIFEPFFSTKPRDVGTGLGLATTYGIVKQNGGFIDVDSELGRGTTFYVYLPAGNIDELTSDVTESRSPDTHPHEETILLVEDEPALLRLATQFLEQLGYKALPANSPVRALEIAGQHQSLDLLMTDVIMPEMNGNDLLAKVRRLHPDLRCLFVSGYAADVIADQGMDNKVNFLEKPFTKAGLAEKLREILAHDL